MDRTTSGRLACPHLAPYRPTHAQAARALAEQDAVIAGLVARAGLPRIRRSGDSHFASLVRAVVHQQLAGAAAGAIHRRLVAALGGEVAPERLLRLSDAELRGAGLSAGKVESLRDLSARVLEGTLLLEPRRLAREGDEAIVERLRSVRGVGRWTAQMFLLFQLRRLDVWPAGDLGVRRGYGLAYGVSTPTERELEQLGAAFAPYRSVAAWYCWRACELLAGARAGEPDDTSLTIA